MAIGISLAPDINATGLNYRFFQFFFVFQRQCYYYFLKVFNTSLQMLTYLRLSMVLSDCQKYICIDRLLQPWIVVNISLLALVSTNTKDLPIVTFESSSSWTAGVKTSSICKQFTRFWASLSKPTSLSASRGYKYKIQML